MYTHTPSPFVREEAVGNLAYRGSLFFQPSELGWPPTTTFVVGSRGVSVLCARHSSQCIPDIPYLVRWCIEMCLPHTTRVVGVSCRLVAARSSSAPANTLTRRFFAQSSMAAPKSIPGPGVFHDAIPPIHTHPGCDACNKRSRNMGPDDSLKLLRCRECQVAQYCVRGCTRHFPPTVN